MSILLTILAEFAFVILLILLFYRLKPWLGLVPLFVLLGSYQYFQTILANSFKISLFNQFTVSPGAIILFSATLFAILLLYIKEGSATAQKLIFAIIITNISFTVLSYISHYQQNTAYEGFPGLAPDLFNINYKIFFIGSIALLLDAFLIVILYELLYSRIKRLNLFFRLLFTMLIVLNFDAVIFILGSFWNNPNLGNLIVGQLIAKSFSAFFFAGSLFLYLRYFDNDKDSGRLLGLKLNEDIFSILSYQGKYERLKTEKAISDEQLQAIISEKTAEQEESLHRYSVLATVKELRLDKYSSSEQGKEFLIKVKEAFRVDACTIHLINNEELELLTDIGITDHNKEYKLVFTFPYLQKMINERQSLCIEDTRIDPIFNYDEQQKDTTVFSYISCAGAPLIAADKVIGILKLYTVTAKHIFSKIEMEHLQQVADQVAHSIDANELFQQNEKHKEVLVKQIIARKKAEEAITESEEKYRTLTETIPDYIMRYDEQGRHTYMNQAALMISGKSADDVIGKTHLEAGYDKEQSAFWEEKIRHVFQTGEVYQEQFSWKSAKGEIFLDWRLSPEINENGKVISVLGVSRDITNIKQAEKEIIESEIKFRNLIESVTDAFAAMDKNLCYTYINKKCGELLGRDPEYLIGKHIYTEFPEVVGQPFHRALEKAIKEQQVVHLEEHYAPYDKWFESHTYPSADGVSVFFTDITDRKNIEIEIATIQKRFQNLVENISGVYWVNDLETNKTLYISPSYEQVWGRKCEDLYADPADFLDAVYEEDKAILTDAYKHIEKTRQTNITYRIVNKKKEIRWIIARTTVVEDENGHKIEYGYAEDITDQKNTSEAIENYNTQLRQLTAHLQSIREEERRRIGREIHDDLGQQLTAIKMDAAWIDKKTPDMETLIKEKLKNIIELLDSSNQSVRRILSELKPSILDEYGLLDAMNWHGSQFAINTGIPIEIICSDKEIKLTENIATCVFRVFQESLTNVTRYANAKKVITLVKRSKNNISVSIQDDGIGFDISQISGNGTFGILGMQERVSALGGKFTIVSEKEKGTMITIKIPIKV